MRLRRLDWLRGSLSFLSFSDAFGLFVNLRLGVLYICYLGLLLRMQIIWLWNSFFATELLLPPVQKNPILLVDFLCLLFIGFLVNSSPLPV